MLHYRNAHKICLPLFHVESMTFFVVIVESGTVWVASARIANTNDKNRHSRNIVSVFKIKFYYTPYVVA